MSPAAPRGRGLLRVARNARLPRTRAAVSLKAHAHNLSRSASVLQLAVRSRNHIARKMASILISVRVAEQLSAATESCFCSGELVARHGHRCKPSVVVFGTFSGANRRSRPLEGRLGATVVANRPHRKNGRPTVRNVGLYPTIAGGHRLSSACTDGRFRSSCQHPIRHHSP